KFMEVGIQFAPFVVLAVLAYAGLKDKVTAIFTYIWLAIVGFLVLSWDMILVLGSFIRDPKGTTISQIFKPGVGPALLWTMLLLMVASLVSLAMLWRPVRVAVSRVVPIDPDNFVHKIAICMLALLLLSSFVPIIVLGGRPPFLEV